MTDALQQLSPNEFPPLLREIPDPPKQLWLQGKLPSPELVWLTVVGSRAYTPYGKQACEHLIEGLRGSPVVVVSGLALGIDSIAHKAALKVGLPTVSIPGSGLDSTVLYPRSNAGLGHAIVEAGGALLSEYEPKEKAAPWMFLKRNRLMAGIAHATLIIEATEKSGTLVTAKLASEYNRDLLVVPGSIFNHASRGTHLFARLGATPVASSAEILDALGIETRPADVTANRDDLSPDEQRVLALLNTPRPRDELIRELKMQITEANVLLSTMELKGLVAEELGLVRGA